MHRTTDMMAVSTNGTTINGEASATRVNRSELRKNARRIMGKKYAILRTELMSKTARNTVS